MINNLIIYSIKFLILHSNATSWVDIGLLSFFLLSTPQGLRWAITPFAAQLSLWFMATLFIDWHYNRDCYSFLLISSERERGKEREARNWPPAKFPSCDLNNLFILWNAGNKEVKKDVLKMRRKTPRLCQVDSVNLNPEVRQKTDRESSEGLFKREQVEVSLKISSSPLIILVKV